MAPIKRNSPFTFAEIVVAAPWTVSLLTRNEDNDKADLLQCNNDLDRRSSPADPPGVYAVEVEARRLRTRIVAEAIGGFVHRLIAVVRAPRAAVSVARVNAR
jgi:hypothetical protein